MTSTITLKEQLTQVTKREAYNRGYLTALITALRVDPLENLDEVASASFRWSKPESFPGSMINKVREESYNKGRQKASIDIANCLFPLLQGALDREITDTMVDDNSINMAPNKEPEP